MACRFPSVQSCAEGVSSFLGVPSVEQSSISTGSQFRGSNSVNNLVSMRRGTSGVGIRSRPCIVVLRCQIDGNRRSTTSSQKETSTSSHYSNYDDISPGGGRPSASDARQPRPRHVGSLSFLKVVLNEPASVEGSRNGLHRHVGQAATGRGTETPAPAHVMTPTHLGEESGAGMQHGASNRSHLEDQEHVVSLQGGLVAERVAELQPAETNAAVEASLTLAADGTSPAAGDKGVEQLVMRNVVEDSWRTLMRWSRHLKRRHRAQPHVLDRTAKVVVFGGGSFGTAIAASLARQREKINVTLLLRDPDACDEINSGHRNVKYLPVRAVLLARMYCLFLFPTFPPP